MRFNIFRVIRSSFTLFTNKKQKLSESTVGFSLAYSGISLKIGCTTTPINLLIF